MIFFEPVYRSADAQEGPACAAEKRPRSGGGKEASEAGIPVAGHTGGALSAAESPMPGIAGIHRIKNAIVPKLEVE